MIVGVVLAYVFRLGAVAVFVSGGYAIHVGAGRMALALGSLWFVREVASGILRAE